MVSISFQLHSIFSIMSGLDPTTELCLSDKTKVNEILTDLRYNSYTVQFFRDQLGNAMKYLTAPFKEM